MARTPRPRTQAPFQLAQFQGWNSGFPLCLEVLQVRISGDPGQRTLFDVSPHSEPACALGQR